MNDYYCEFCERKIRIAYKLHMMEKHGELLK